MFLRRLKSENKKDKNEGKKFKLATHGMRVLIKERERKNEKGSRGYFLGSLNVLCVVQPYIGTREHETNCTLAVHNEKKVYNKIQ
jgi:hypothetical protein